MKNQSITSLPRSPQDDRRARMIKYSLAMGIRMVCILSLVFVQGWWLLIMAIGAIVLPYIAVVLANVGARPGTGIEAPGGREVMLRNPQTPVVVPPADDAPAEGPATAWPGSADAAGPRFTDGFGTPFAQGPGATSGQGFEPRRAGAPGSPFPASAHGPFAQPAGSSSPHADGPSAAPSAPSAPRSAEGQA